ncbi:MAG: methyltransferase type 11 [Candidatus Sericytochromatia bacterium]|nr:MAG: methyltransferase type 11 [Candidatus Sericytochromatia bacterium]
MQKDLTDWTKTFFGDNYLKLHLPILSDELNKEEVDFIINILKPQKGSKFLDIPCGYGRHSKLLVEKGMQVTGIDNNSTFIEIAKENCKDAKFILEDMRKINFYNDFDFIINLFTSFGYFSDEENFDVIKRFAKALKKGGKLLIETINREWALKQTSTNGLTWLLYPSGMVFLANNKYDIITGRWTSEQYVVDNNKISEQEQNVRLYTYTEYKMMFSQVGLKIIEVYGEKDLSPYTCNSNKIILVAEKI